MNDFTPKEVAELTKIYDERENAAQELAPEVARKLGLGDQGEAHFFLMLPTMKFGNTLLLPFRLHPQAIRQFAQDLLQDKPSALSVRDAVANTQAKQQNLGDVRVEQFQRLAQETGLNLKQSPKDEKDEAARKAKLQEIDALIEATEAFRLALGDVTLAGEQQRRNLEVWARPYWPTETQRISRQHYEETTGDKKTGKPRPLLPQTLPHPTFMEARQFTNAISDGRDGRHWGEVQGALALLHCPPKANHQTRFEPNGTLLNWWGISGAQPQHLYEELARLDFDAVILFQVTLSAILHTEKARWSEVSLDSIIKLIGRDSDARRSTKAREEWRGKVWRWLVLFDSMTVHGARPGRWREPGTKGEKRIQMETQTLHSSDPLIRIVGTRDTEQGTFDGSAPPKEVSIVPGDWLMKFHGNREMLSEMGDVLKIAQISRGKPSGAWAACAGLMLNQLWREEATRATKGRNSRGKENKIEVLRFRPFTRRELLAETVRSDYDVHTILNDPKGRQERINGYWTQAVKELKKCGVIGHYRELAPKLGRDWREEWLDQPLEIRPGDETLADALAINKSAEAARRRGRAKSAKKELPKP